ncbi:MAG: glycosyltransferase [Phycisphaerae bacterium]|jgi:glycosyltransferase involved in cell wall biosynthesis
MKIVFVSYEFPPQFGGGIGTFVDAMTRILARTGHDITVITVTDGPTPKRDGNDAGVACVRMPIPHVGGADPGATLKFWQLRADMVHDVLQGMIAANQVDVIEFGDYRGEAATFLSATRREERPPTIVRLHTPLVVLNRYNRHRQSAKVLEAFENEPIIGADHLISPSRVLAAEMQALVPELADREITIHPYPVDWRFVERSRAGEPRTNEVLYVGRMEERKGVQSLVQAASTFLRACPDATLRMVGGDTPLSASEPSLLAVLQRMVPADIKDRIIFQRAVPREQLVEMYAAAKVCVFPSLFENFPNVCLEAMALRGCVVAGHNTGMAEMIEDGESGFIFRSGDVQELAHTLIKAYTLSESQRNAVGEAAHQRVKTLYKPEAVAQSYIDLCEGYIKQRNHERQSAGLSRRPRATTAKRTPRVGVVIPCFNHGAFIDDAIASVRAQTRKVDDIIIVDDGGTDPFTCEHLPKVAMNGVRLLRQHNQGLAMARNNGIADMHAREPIDYFVALDADDTIEPMFAEKLLNQLEANPHLGYAYSTVSYFGAHVGAWQCPAYDPARLTIENMSVATAVVRTQAWQEVGGYNADMIYGFEDWDFWLALLCKGWHGTRVDEPLFNYRKHAGGSMLARTQERRGEMIARMVEHHRWLYERIAPYVITEKDRLFFREHMDLWLLREHVAKLQHTAPPSPLDQPTNHAHSHPVERELAAIEQSFAWRTVTRLKNNPVYDAVARARWGSQWKMLDTKETPHERLARIKNSRSYRMIVAIKQTGVYKRYAKMKYGG